MKQHSTQINHSIHGLTARHRICLHVKSQDFFQNVFQIKALQFRPGPNFIQERNQRF